VTTLHECLLCEVAFVKASLVLIDPDGEEIDPSELVMVYHYATVHPGVIEGTYQMPSREVAEYVLSQLHEANIDPHMSYQKVE